MYENIDKNLYTPMMRQYLEIKETLPDTLVFFRLGDFYEMFFNDAIIASKELELFLTKRDAGVENEPVPMCGVPHHAVETYIEKLSEKGYKVAIVEQLEDPKSTKNIVKRDVTRIITPGTNIDEVYLDDKTNNYLGSIDKLSDKLFELSYVDLSTGACFYTEFTNISLLYSELIKLNIKEVVTRENLPLEISNYLKNILGIVISVESNVKTEGYLNDLFKVNHSNCSKRLINYVIETQKRVLLHLKPFEIVDNKDYLKLSSNTVKTLELVESIKGDKNRNNLFSLLDECKTSMGSRFLKKSLLYPLVDLNKINERLSLIEELSNHYISLSDLEEDLSHIYDLERIIGRVCYGNVQPKDLLWLRESLKYIPHIKRILSSIKEKSFKEFNSNINEFKEVFELLEKAINDDPNSNLNLGGVIKSGYNSELDDIRNINSTNKEFLEKFEENEKIRTGIKNLKVGYNRVFGYYIEVTKSQIPFVKDEFGYIRKQTTSNSERYITQELKERETLILRSNERSIELEKEIFEELRKYILNYSKELQVLASNISYLDMIVSLTKVAKKYNFVKPEFSEYSDMFVLKGFHPILKGYSNEDIIPNDLYLSSLDEVLLITGPNMAGKSTFMRQNALIVILAQMGSFVPAEKAVLPLFDAIYTRIGSSDDITKGESTFMSEMLEVNDALINATSRSLLIFDEVGRGTATFDGMALAQSIIEFIHDKLGAKTLFSTHYHELTSLDKSLIHLKNVHVDAIVNGDDLIFSHLVKEGPSSESYGINVAKLSGINEEITYRAMDLLNKMKESNEVNTDLLSKDHYVKPQIIEKKVYVEKNNQVLENILYSTNLDEITAKEALNILYNMKEEINNDKH